MLSTDRTPLRESAPDQPIPTTPSGKQRWQPPVLTKVPVLETTLKEGPGGDAELMAS